MKIHEPECVALKRQGAEYVSALPEGKTQSEKLEFWKKRTEALLAKQAKYKLQTVKNAA